MALRAGERLGPYEILGALGAGGMGEVYRARDHRLERAVAIKVLPATVSADPSRRRRFEHEARATGALNHPNVLAVYDVGTTRARPCPIPSSSPGREASCPRRRTLDGPRPGRRPARRRGPEHERSLRPRLGGAVIGRTLSSFRSFPKADPGPPCGRP